MAEPVIMISACLLGIECRYDGGSKPVPGLPAKLAGFKLVPFCPEVWGGLPTPRPPAEIRAGDGAAVLAGTARVVDRTGRDRTAEFRRGAERLLEQVRQWQPVWIIAKAKSPSCGVGRIYDGNFAGQLRDGDGVAVALLRQAGITAICTEAEIEPLLQNLSGNNC